MAEPAGIRTPASVPPRTPHEEAILGIWRDILGRSDIGVLDDFFDLDGNSLNAIQVIARIRETWGVSVRAMDFFESPTVATLALAVAGASPSERPVVSRRPPDAEPVLSFDQQRLWLEGQLLPGAAYHVHGRQRLIGPLDVAALGNSIRAILNRHEVLRSRFPTVDGRPVQIVDDLAENWHIRIEDLSGVVDDRGGAAKRLADDEAIAPFDLAQGPLVRCLLIKLSEAEHILSVTAHHIVCDDWSVGLFGRELSALYRAGGDVRRTDLLALEIQYRDYAVWQRRWLTGDALEREVSYWRRHLAGAPPALALPSKRWRSPSDVPEGGRVRAALSKEETAGVHDLCRRHGVTSFMVLLASLATVLSRWSGQRDMVIGVPITGRTDAKTETLIGFFVNTLPLRVDLAGDPTFAELLERVRQAAVGGYAHADAPLDLLVRELPAIRVPGRTPLFQVILNVVDSPPEVEPLSGVSGELLDAPARPSKFDITLTAREWHGVLNLDLEFNTDRYEQAMLEVLLGHMSALLRAATEDPTKSIFDYSLQVIIEEEAAEVSSVDGPTALPLGAIERFAQLPDRVAVISRDGEWGYRRLNSAADRVARALTHRFPPHADNHFGVVWRPTATFVATILGCMKAGATFSVTDAGGPTPLPWISAVLDVSPGGGALDATMDLRAVLRDEAGPLPANQTGATGPPMSGGDWAVERYGFDADDRFAVLSRLPGHLLSALSSAFDVGATLVLSDHSFTDDPSALLSWLDANSISVAYVTPPILRAMTARPKPLPALRHVFVDNSGDFVSHDIEALRHLSATCRCVGLYRVGRDGRPTAAYVVPDGWKLETAPVRVPLGMKLDDAARLVHPSGRAAAIGEVAEICLGTHRTGDLGRRWSDGTIEFVTGLGGDLTADPVETTGVLRGLPEVYDALVAEHPEADGSSVLLGYVAGPDRTLDVADIHQRLVTRLPDYLIPHQVVVLDRLPLTGAGDYDLVGLPQPDADSTPLDSYVAPRTPVELQLTGILRELLAADRIGVHDSFFELGGFSLLATQLSSRIRESIQVELTLRDIFESATVEVLAQRIVRAQAEQAAAEDVEALLDELES